MYVSVDTEQALVRPTLYGGQAMQTQLVADATGLDMVAVAKWALSVAKQQGKPMPRTVLFAIHGPCSTYSVLLRTNKTHRDYKNSQSGGALPGPAGADARADDNLYQHLLEQAEMLEAWVWSGGVVEHWGVC